MMDGLELFHIPENKFSDGAEFRNYLVENYNPNETTHELSIIVGITNYKSENEFFDALKSFGFQTVNTLGAVRHLKIDIGDDRLECYVTYEIDTGIIVFYTNYRKTKEIPKIREFLKSDRECYYLIFTPLLMKQLIGELIEEYRYLEIHEFTAKRPSNSHYNAKIRPNYERTITYWGKDGKETLFDFIYHYGVLPTMFIVNIPNIAKFKVSWNGIFTFSHGDLLILFKLLGYAIDESRKAMEAFNGSSFKVVPIKTAHRLFEVPSSIPISIKLNETLAYYQMNVFQESLKKSKYTIVDFSAQEGSLFLSTNVISKSGYQFRIKANEHNIKMFPDSETVFSEFMKFYEFILNSVDPSAELVT